MYTVSLGGSNMIYSETFECDECGITEHWTKDMIYEEDYPQFERCRTCEVTLCYRCLDDHWRNNHE